MANIDHYLEEIELASRGEEVRDSIIDAFEALNSEGPGTMKWENITDTPDTLTGYGISDVPASMVSGVLALNNIPPSALERVVPVANDTARFALTLSDVQNGDTVKVLSTQKLYLVVDDTSLSTEAGYEEYRAGTADSVDWSGVLNTPDTLAGYGIEDAYTKTQVDTSLAAKSDKATTYTKSDVDAIVNTDDDTSEAGNPIVVETDAAQYAKKTHLTLEPVQDLHGYDHPWPAGGGKNLLPLTVDDIKTANTGTWSGNSITINGVTFTILTDSAGNITGIKANGTASGVALLQISPEMYFTEGQKLSGITNSTGDGIGFGFSGVGMVVTNPDYTISASLASVKRYLYVRVDSGFTANNVIFYPMIRLASVSDATFAPYSNICPITGVDEVEVRTTEKNLFGGEANALFRLFIPSGTTVTASDLGGGNVRYYDAYQNEIDYWTLINTESVSGRKYRSFTVSSDTYFVKFDIGSITASDFQLEVGSAPTSYEPYTEYTASLDLPETVYGGTLDLETGELVVDMAYDVFDGSSDERWSDAAGGYVIINALTRGHNAPITNRFLGAVSGSITAPNIFYNSLAYYNYRFGLSDPSVTDLASFKTWLSNNPIQVCCKLAAPITYTLTPKQLALLKGTNNISTNAKTVQVTYRNGELATTGDIVASTEVAKQNAIGESASYTDARLATELAPILGDLATAETSPTSASHAIGEYLLYNNRLYKVLAAISAGQQLTIGTNIGQTNVAAELTSLEQRLQALEAS